jgi:hypothetical protein
MKFRSWFSRMERRLPKPGPSHINVTSVDGQTLHIKRTGPLTTDSPQSTPPPIQDPSPNREPRQPNSRKPTR